MRKTWKRVLAAVAICALVGCGNADKISVAPASGVVTLDGEPVENARVTFLPLEGAATFSHGTTDASGRFQMSTMGMNDGALIGRHKVIISKVEPPSEAETIDMEAMAESGNYAGGAYEKMMMGGGGGGGQMTAAKQELPKKYSDKAASLIEAVVTAEGPNEFTFNLEK